MYAFVLMLTMFGVDGPDYTYVLDYNLGGEDCITALEKHQALLVQSFNEADFELTCSLDHAPMD